MKEELLSKLTDFFKKVKSFMKGFNSMCPMKVSNKVLSNAENVVSSSENILSLHISGILAAEVI